MKGKESIKNKSGGEEKRISSDEWSMGA